MKFEHEEEFIQHPVTGMPTMEMRCQYKETVVTLISISDDLGETAFQEIRGDMETQLRANIQNDVTGETEFGTITFGEQEVGVLVHAMHDYLNNIKMIYANKPSLENNRKLRKVNNLFARLADFGFTMGRR